MQNYKNMFRLFLTLHLLLNHDNMEQQKENKKKKSDNRLEVLPPTVLSSL